VTHAAVRRRPARGRRGRRQARYEEAVVLYAARVRQAVREVEEALVNLEAPARAARTRAPPSRATGLLRATEARYRSGLGSLIELEDQRRVLLVAELRWWACSASAGRLDRAVPRARRRLAAPRDAARAERDRTKERETVIPLRRTAAACWRSRLRWRPAATRKEAAKKPAATTKPALTVTTVPPQQVMLPLTSPPTATLAAWAGKPASAPRATACGISEVLVNVATACGAARCWPARCRHGAAEAAQAQAALAEAEASAAEAANNAARARTLSQTGAMSASQIQPVRHRRGHGQGAGGGRGGAAAAAAGAAGAVGRAWRPTTA
jgi:hypothetical protein